MLLLRLDDAAEYMDTVRWDRMETLLNRFKITPIVGIIPDCKDEKYCREYDRGTFFWEKAKKWESSGWVIAQHGFEHVYCTDDGGINPYVQRSEFAGLPLADQKEKIKRGYQILTENGLKPIAFFAPSHTFDDATVEAIKTCTPIRIICDRIATDIFWENDMTFIPLLSSKARKLPLRFQMFCYHPNTMNDTDFLELEAFLKKHQGDFVSLTELQLPHRKRSVTDSLLHKLYFGIRKRRTIK